MHLLDILTLRTVPAAGVFLALTRRCPLLCAHCSTNSTMWSEEHDEDLFVRFVQSFTPDDRPEIVALTGGEALLRPKLVERITEHVHAVGAKVYLISGMFFARSAAVPPAIDHVIAGVDHFTASLDIFHEQQVPRAAMLRTLERIVDRGQDVSIQLVGAGDGDPYLAEATAAIRRWFGDRVPMLVGGLAPYGTDSGPPVDDCTRGHIR